jgi:hypothetical protein
MKTLAEEFKALAARHNITVFVDQLYSRMMCSCELCNLSRVKKAPLILSSNASNLDESRRFSQEQEVVIPVLKIVLSSTIQK